MPPRASFKADSSFFEKITIGVVGAKAVCRLLASSGHEIVELERGALDTKLWKEVKRKRIRIPDLVCTRCGQRIESRAKTRPELSMSHSPKDSERAWDFGMLPSDWIAFPICEAVARKDWMQGRLSDGNSYWHERRWVRWQPRGAVNIFDVESFRAALPRPKPAKGVTEGSETQVFWPAAFVTKDGVITRVEVDRIRYADQPGSRERYIKLSGSGRERLKPAVVVGETVRSYQILAAVASPLSRDRLVCRNDLNEATVESMLRSRERTVRYTGCRLAKLLRLVSLGPLISDLARDPAEDLYTRLEARSYVITIGAGDAHDEFRDVLQQNVDASWRLEGIVTLADTPSASARELLTSVLVDPGHPLFLRSAAAWALGHFPAREAAATLVRTFADVDRELRNEAVMALVQSGTGALDASLEGLAQGPGEVAAGCFEVLRRLGTTRIEVLVKLAEGDRAAEWAVWLLASLPRDQVASAIASWQARRPDLHFALSVLWSFLESWVSETWERDPNPQV
jgi:hypothetical protein